MTASIKRHFYFPRNSYPSIHKGKSTPSFVSKPLKYDAIPLAMAEPVKAKRSI